MDKQIFWLASYPKSGNTLLRFILIALFFTDDGIFSFDKSKYISQFETVPHIKKNKEIFENDYKKIGNIKILYKYFKELQSKKCLNLKEDFIFLKTHAGLFKIDKYLFTREIDTRGLIYVVRDPRDVCISWAKHNGWSVDESINFMVNDYAIYSWPQLINDQEKFSEKENPKSFMSSWEKHVESWIKVNWKTPKLIIKYEELVYEKRKTLEILMKFFSINYNFKFKNLDQKIENIIKSTNFGEFQKYEEKHGFKEASEHNSFFSVGKKNQWKGKLNDSQLQKIENKFNKIMEKFNYK